MKKAMLLFVILALALVLTSTAVAQISFGPRVGYYKSQDADKAQMYGGAAARFKLFGIGAEASIDYRQEKYENGALTVRSWPVQVSALWYPLPIVYGLAGAGWYHATMDFDQEKIGLGAPEDKTTSTMGYHIGAGAELPLGGMKLVGDIRYVFLDYDFEEIPGSGDTKANFYAITVGLLWNL